MSSDAPTTQICSPTVQNTQKPTPTKEAAFGRPPLWFPPLWFPLWVLVFVYFGLLGYISVLLGHLLTLLPYQLSRQIVYLRAFTSVRRKFERILKIDTWKIRTVFYECAVLKRVCGHESGKLSILIFLVHNMAIWSVPREPQRNSTHISIDFCPKRPYQLHFAKIFHLEGLSNLDLCPT